MLHAAANEEMRSACKQHSRICATWIITLAIGAVVAATAKTVAVTSLLNAPPEAIEVQAEPITAFDLHDLARQRFGQLEFRGGLTLKSNSGNLADSSHSFCTRWYEFHLAERSRPLVQGTFDL